MSRPVAIGERGRRFTLQVPVETPDGFGGVLRTFQPGPRLWGAMRLVGDGERRGADRITDEATHRVTLAWQAGVAGGAQLTLGPRRFRIRSAADPDGRRRELVCLVEEIRP